MKVYLVSAAVKFFIFLNMTTQSRFIDWVEEELLLLQTGDSTTLPVDGQSHTSTLSFSTADIDLLSSASVCDDDESEGYTHHLRDGEHDLLIKPRVDALDRVKLLGEGGSGRVELVLFNGQFMVMKTYLNRENIAGLLKEIRIHRELAGAGGAPEVHGLSLKPARVIMTYTGDTFEHYIQKCTQHQLIESLVIVAEKLQEIHDKGFVHNDLKSDNITVGVSQDLDIHIIDYGLTKKIGDLLRLCGGVGSCLWYAPEVETGEPLTPASDVYSFSFVIEDVLDLVENDKIWLKLLALQVEMRSRDPQARPSLHTVISKLKVFAGSQVDGH
ncbi:probable serine/threonine-protein kinase DDB_G0272092 [Panulirus ornatus]|uniref:probable serine/threonine-protein kinase DDB_G0272092 n=1 Tax=Panulirus ornatus TaxID=150431 RepID=UPI003A87BA60